MTGCTHEHEDGAYVLGALSPDDRAAFERHLPGCPACARSVRELAGLPGLLFRVPVETLDPTEPSAPVPETLLPSLVRRARRSQVRRRWVAGSLAAAAVAAAALVLPTLGSNGSPPAAVPPPSASTAAPSPLTPIGAQPISGWLSLTKAGWGTRLDLTCSYAEDRNAYGEAVDPTYTMFVIHRDGTAEQVASWKALPGRTMHLAGATAATAEDITDVQVRTSAGRTVLVLG